MLFQKSHNLLVEDSSFINNLADRMGGGIGVEVSNFGLLRNLYFNGNIARFGGNSIKLENCEHIIV